ncbi:MAG: malto-oligosyltrehalose trehalohydrolase [Cyclobacteriaceae bacterium]|nr:malto-oligosyltrehalose trehalohydrolase [Cyclobacteriaceae bacterium]
MTTLRVNRKSLGVNFSARGEAEVLVWAPEAKTVNVWLVDKKKQLKLIARDDGYWSCITPAIVLGDSYYLELNGEQFPDPASLHQPQGVSGPSEVFNPGAFHWTDHEWINLPQRDYIIYELHTGTFSAAGTFEGIIEKLPYLNDLGITAIEIMPVAQFSGTRNWGYDGVFPFAVQHSYGGPLGLQKLVDACHAHGIAVILDVVYNHLGPEGNILPAFGPYFTDKYKTPWGQAVNFDDAHCDAVRRYFLENALMWLRDFHIDALRLDAVHAIKDFSPKHWLRELRERVDELMQETNRMHYLMVECDLNDRKFIDPVDAHGYGMHAQWVDEFHHALRVTAGQPKTGYYEDFNGLLHLAKSWQDGYVYTGQYSPHRSKTFGTDTAMIEPFRFVVFSQNHDHVGNRMLGERTSVLVNFEMQKVLAAAVLTSSFLPLLFMGEEYGETNPFLYFVSHEGKELAEAVREGRKREFKAFHIEGEFPDPQREETFRQSKLGWSILRKEEHATLFRYYQQLIALRKKLNAIGRADRENLKLDVFESQQVMLVHRWHAEEHVLCVFNFSNQLQTVSSALLDKPWKLVLNSAASEWCGVNDLDFNQTNRLVLAPESFLLLTHV